MIKNDKTYTGYITYTNGNFGFIETENANPYFFFIDKNEQIQLKRQKIGKKMHIFCSGDEVKFELRISKKDSNKIEAYNLKFIKNERREKLIEEANQSDNLLGYIKLIDNEKLFVKHKSTYVYIPIEISDWETNIQEIYTNRIERLVTFKLTQIHQIDRLKAVLTDAKFIDEYYELKLAIDNAKIILGKITGKNSKGLFAKILNGRIDGFIPISKKTSNAGLLKFEKLKKGNITNVRVKQILNGRRVLLALTD